MNQILYTGGKKGNGGMLDSNKLIIVFIVIIIIFAICVIGIGANLLSKVQNGNTANANTTNTTPGTPDEPAKPTEPDNPVESKIEIVFEPQLGKVIIKVKSELKITSIAYWWDEEDPILTEIDENEYEIVVPSKQGAHTLNVEVTDENGTIKTEEQRVIGDSKPELTIGTDRVSNYVIKAKDDEEIDRIVILINGTIIEEFEVKAKEIEHKVPIPQGDSIIEVIVYNLNGISVNKKAKITNYGG